MNRLHCLSRIAFFLSSLERAYKKQDTLLKPGYFFKNPCYILFLYQPSSTGGQQAGPSPGDALSFRQLLDPWDGARRLWLLLGMASSCCVRGSDRRGRGAVGTVWCLGCSPAVPGAGPLSLHSAGALHWNLAVKIPFLPLWRKQFLLRQCRLFTAFPAYALYRGCIVISFIQMW